MVQKPSDKEQEYFLQQELARLRELREQYRRQQAEEERRRLKELHFMHCPKCGQRMEVSQLAGVEVEVCPDCGGMFLDAGELDKVLEESRRGPFAQALAAVRKVFRG
ncbi:MAG: zf-TFIIB domain-containing protein [Thermoanaerobaculum sp.]|nr:zf-TFIIB domain-containing protein [Thermoanaerobaculum sp.]